MTNLRTCSFEERFWHYIEKTDTCWMWRGATSAGRRYGQIKRDGRSLLVHRVSYEQLVGPIPDGLHLDHLCRNTFCVNPSHLEPVSCRENLLRGQTHAARNAAKTRCRKGHPYDEVNTYLDSKRGIRNCRTCRNESKRQYKARKRAAK